jgi:hypothetical protein
VVEGGAGLAVIQDGALTVGFGGASGSLLNWGLEEGFVTGFGAGVVFPVGSCSVELLKVPHELAVVYPRVSQPSIWTAVLALGGLDAIQRTVGSRIDCYWRYGERSLVVLIRPLIPLLAPLLLSLL